MNAGMTHKAWHPLLIVALLATAQTGWSQRASNWRGFRVGDGLPESACVALTISPQGKVLARHLAAAALSELDGYHIKVLPASEVGSSRVYESPGGQLWTAIAQGLEEYRDGAWALRPVPEFAVAFRSGIDPVPLCPLRQGVVLCLLPAALLEYNSEDPSHPRSKILRAVSQTGLKKFSGMTFPLSRDGGLWVCGAKGLAHISGPLRSLKSEVEWIEYLPPESLHVENLSSPHEDASGGITMLAESPTNHEKLIVYFNGKEWSARPGGADRLREAWRGPEGTFWAATIDSLLQVTEDGKVTENEEISARQYFDVATEPNGNFWIATSEGLFRYAAPVWQSPPSAQNVTSPILSLAADSQDQLWFISLGKLHLLQEGGQQESPLPGKISRWQGDISVYPLKDGNVLLAADNGLVRFEPATKEYKQVFPRLGGQQMRLAGSLKDGKFLVQISSRTHSGETATLEVFDGFSFEVFTDTPTDWKFGPRVTSVFTAQNGDIWLGGEHGVAWFRDKKWRYFVSTEKSMPEAPRAFVEMPEGKIWCATADKIWEFDGRNWSAIRRGFERINGLLRAHDGSVWVGSNNGLHRFFQGAWVENGAEESLPSSVVRAVVEDRRGRIWAGTTHGLSLFHPDADSDPPQTRIYEAARNDYQVREGNPVTLNFKGQDKWKYCPRERLLYSYKFDTGEWSPFQEQTTVSFNDLASGKHYFQVRAMDRTCNIDPKPQQLEFAIIAPWYKELRLVVISLAGMGIAIFFAAVAFNRHRQLVLSYAEVERKVAQRTHELEIANRELVHSQKMNALGALAAGIAHDFNNILSIIKGSAQIIEDNMDNPQKVCTRVDRIKTAVEQGAGIVKAMLGFTRNSDQNGPCDLNSIVSDTLKLLGDRFLRETQIAFQPSTNLPEITVSRDLIQQILLNFLFNAAESMPESKQIILTTQLVKTLPSGLALVPAKTDSYVAVSVQDFGCGIKPEVMPRIFEPFFTTKALSARRGTGLGLSMVYELAKKMEAGLAVESVVDEGSTFTLIIPVQNVPKRTQTTETTAAKTPVPTS